MTSIQILLVIHLLGFATLFSATVGGWILHAHYRNAGDYQSKALLLKSLRPFGILSPVAVLVMVASGIGNMVYFGLGPFSEGWLSAKLVVVFIIVVNGIIFGTRSVRRGKLVAELAEGGASEHTRTGINALDKQLSGFYAAQLMLLLIVLVLSVVRP
jgi:uncharacterized membrane protein SirB2